jgi:hypothetical protein
MGYISKPLFDSAGYCSKFINNLIYEELIIILELAGMLIIHEMEEYVSSLPLW